MIVHASVAYCSIIFVFKRKGKELESALDGEKGQKMMGKISDAVMERMTQYLEELFDPEKKDDPIIKHRREVIGAFLEALKHSVITGLKEYIGGMESATRNKVNAKIDIPGMIAQFIMGKVMQQMAPIMGNPPPPGG